MIFGIDFFIFFVTILNLVSSERIEEVTLPVQARVQLLKDAINRDLINKKYNDQRAGMFAKLSPIYDLDDKAEYEYEDEMKLTPIMDNDERKVHGKHALKRIKTKKTTLFVGKTTSQKLNANLTLTTLTAPISEKKKRSKYKSPNLRFKDIFYRRYLSTIPVKDRQYLHCVDLITPYMRGHKTKMTDVKRIPYDAGVVMRLVQLISESPEDHTKDDIRSIMYQISNLQIRLFQWDITAMKLLLHALTHDPTKKYTFKAIKNGLKNLFASWQLDLSNTTNLLKQARIFRPPCVVITPNTGSTKSPSSTSYTQPTTRRAKRPCLEYSNERDRNVCESYYHNN